MRSLIALIIMLLHLQVSDAKTSDDKTAHLQLSQSLFTAVMGEYFENTSKSFDPKALAHKAYFATLFNDWSKKIENGKYRSSEEIFKAIKKSPSYLGRYSEILDAVQGSDYKSSRFVNLYQARNQFLGYVIYSETKFPDLKQRVLNILDKVNLLLITNSRAYDLARLIVYPFMENEDLEIRRKSNQVLGAIGFTKGVSILVFLRNLAAFSAGARLSFGSTPAFVTTGGNYLKGVAQTLLQNPLTRRISLGHSASMALHASIPAYLLLKKPDPSGNSNEDLEISIAKLWQATAMVFPDLVISQETDFQTQFFPVTRLGLVQKVKAAVDQSSTSFDYLEAFIQSEKHFHFDFRKDGDQLAMDYILKQIKTLQRDLHSSYSGRTLKAEDVEAIRTKLITEPLRKYQRDYPNLSSVLLGWGGNCVAQTMLMVGLLNPYRDQLPEGERLGVALFSDHVEPVLIGRTSLSFLISGEKTAKTNARLYRPEYLLNVLMRNYFEASTDMSADKFEIAHTGMTESDHSLSNFKDLLKAVFTRLVMNIWSDRRFGVLENFGSGESGQLAFGGAMVPKSAEMRYSPMHQKAPSSNEAGNGKGSGTGNGSSGFLSALWDTSGESGKVKPKIEIVYSPKTDPISFRYDPETQTITAHTKEFYTELYRASVRPDFYPPTFLTEQLEKDFKAFLNSYDYTKNVHDLSIDISKLKNISAQEMVFWNMHYEKFQLQFVQETMAILQDSTSVHYTLGEYRLDIPMLIDTQLKYRLEREQIRLLEAIAENPRKFLRVYGELNSSQREAVMGRFFPKPMLSRFAQYGAFQNTMSSEVARMQTLAMNQIKFFLDEISKNQVKIQTYIPLEKIVFMIDVRNFNPSKSPIPFTLAGKPSEGGKGPEKENIKKTVTSSSEETDPLSLYPEMLIEFAVLFEGAGLQIWDANVVDYFTKNNRWGFIVNGDLAQEALKRTLQYNPPKNMKTEEMKRLSEYLN
jgi:hypothetical protein